MKKGSRKENQVKFEIQLTPGRGKLNLNTIMQQYFDTKYVRDMDIKSLKDKKNEKK